ncbi:MAG TPA: serine hydrolase [Cyclobacteriaceae bacterium]|nr:serine hydrolase [Cyclobacteriaceae bacterium]
MSRLFLAPFFLLVVSLAVAQDRKSKWVDSVFATLGPQEKIGQLMVVMVSPEISNDDLSLLSDQAKANKIGSLVILKNGPVRYANITNRLQSLTKVPILITTGFPNGLLAFDSTLLFYDSAVIKAVDNDSLKKALKAEVASEVRMLAINGEMNLPLNTLGGLTFSEMLGQPNIKKNKPAPSPLASTDLLLVQKSAIDAIIKSTTKSMKKDKLLAIKIDSSVKKILRLKFDAGLFKERYINTDNLIGRLHSVQAQLIKEQLANESVTVVKNDSSLIPIQRLDDKTFASISIGSSGENEFTHYLSKYAWFRHHFVQSVNDTLGMAEKLSGKDVIVVGLFASPTNEMIEFVKKLSTKHKLIISSFTDANTLAPFEQMPSLISAYSSENGIPKAAAEIVFGAIEAKGKLSEKISDSLAIGKSIHTTRIDRFSYVLPESAGMDSRTLGRIESIANEAISAGATPCINVFVAKNGKVVYEKSFGTLTYDKKSPVTDETIFDLASITKVSATLQTVMYMQEKGMIDVNKKASVYLPELKGSNKEDFIIKDIITHQAGLWPFLPFWVETVKDTALWKKYYSKTENQDYPFPVSENMFASKAMKDSLWQWIIKARVREKPARTIYDYRYSDMAFYMMQHLAEKLLGMPMEDFLQKNIYRPIGAYTTGFLPLRKFPATQIAPTEKDTLFRKSLLVGYVHDQGAAMHGGIAGHAGLFSNANDLGKLGQMWLNKGSYGGVQVFRPGTLDLFTAKQYETSRRGLGWDKPVVNDYQASPTSIFSSGKTFGHTGFTGTSIWVDPEFDLVFVFLSNRVNPDMNNNKILTGNIRPRVQDVVYQAIFEYCKTHGKGVKPNDPKFGLTVKP